MLVGLGMMITTRRVSLAAAALAAALVTVLTPGSAGAQFAPDAVTIDRTGLIAPDGTLTLSGTYRCSSRLGPAYIGSEVSRGNAQSSVGGTAATCDGKEHTWRNTSRGAAGRFVAGPAVGEAVLFVLDLSNGLVPIPVVLGSDEHELSLRQGR